MKIAVITYGTPGNKKGAFLATHQRIKNLMLKSEFQVDVYIIRYYENWLIQVVRKRKYVKEKKEEFFIYDNVKYRNLWISFTFIDYFQRYRFNRVGVHFSRFARSAGNFFDRYDLISAHSFEPAVIAMYAANRFKIPFAITWHGSDIHTTPKINFAVKKLTAELCRRAAVVFFVSKELQHEAKNLGFNIENSHVSHNGVDNNRFRPYPVNDRVQLKASYKVNGARNVAFIGNLVDIKNVRVLPEIFKICADNVEGVKFYFIGDGNLREVVSEKCRELDLDVCFMGNRAYEEMPELINCFDLVVLPSKNEGLPLIILECLSCEVPILASRVGGIPEILNEKFTVSPGPGFIETFATLAVRELQKAERSVPKIPASFDWEYAGRKEAILYKKLNSN